MTGENVYVAGPMRGIEDLNAPAFEIASLKLIAAGHTVFNPAEQESGRDIREDFAADLKWICESAKAIFMLRGWEHSPGAQSERFLAEALGLTIWYQKGAKKYEVSSDV